MVEKSPVRDAEHFVKVCSTAEHSPLNEGQARELWDIWMAHKEEHNNRSPLLVLIPEWLSEKELDKRRPFMFADIEHDDDSRGAVLFGHIELIDIGAIENKVLTVSESVDIDDIVTLLDISEESEYVDTPGNIWVPRSQMTVFDVTSQAALPTDT